MAVIGKNASRTDRSRQDWQELDKDHHLHPFTDHKDLHEKRSRIITRADGVYIYDADGNKILDAMSGLWCVNIGYGRDELVDAAAAQIGDAGDLPLQRRGKDQAAVAFGPFDQNHGGVGEAGADMAAVPVPGIGLEHMHAAGDGLAAGEPVEPVEAAVEETGQPAAGLPQRPVE